MGQGITIVDANVGRRRLGVPLSAVEGGRWSSHRWYINAMLGGQIRFDPCVTPGPAGAKQGRRRVPVLVAAADTWKVPAECSAANGVVSHKSGKSPLYGALVGKASTMKMLEKVAHSRTGRTGASSGKHKARIDTHKKKKSLARRSTALTSRSPHADRVAGAGTGDPVARSWRTTPKPAPSGAWSATW